MALAAVTDMTLKLQATVNNRTELSTKTQHEIQKEVEELQNDLADAMGNIMVGLFIS